MSVLVELEQDLERRIAGLRRELDAVVKVSVHDLDSGGHASVDGDTAGWAASIIKLPVLVAVAEEIAQGRLAPDSTLAVDHRFTLDPCDSISRLANGSPVRIDMLCRFMIVESDNEATNILADTVGIHRINESMRRLGLNRTMLGHLLCPGVPRHTADFNPDGSNLTCPDDMVTLMRHIYDQSFSQLSFRERDLAQDVLSGTFSGFFRVGGFTERRIVEKVGYITDRRTGDDLHAVGLVDGRLIVCVMVNKNRQGNPMSVYPEVVEALSENGF